MSGTDGGLLLRALRWRAALSATVWVCAVVVVAGAVLGPVFARAASESALRDVLVDAGARTGLQLQGSVVDSSELHPGEALRRAAEPVPRVAHFGAGIGSITLSGTGSTDRGIAMVTQLVWRANACAEVRMVAGRCAVRAGEGMVSTRAAGMIGGWKVGDSVGVVPTLPYQAPTFVRVVGVYAPKDTGSPAWSGRDYFHSGMSAGKDPIPITDAVFTGRGTFAGAPDQPLLRESVDLPLDVASVRLADVPALHEELAAFRAAHRSGQPFRASSALDGVLRSAADQEGRIDATTTLVVLQLCLLGWLVLFQLLLDVAEARAADVALAKLRGFDGWVLLRFGFGEPVLLLAAAVPVGALLGIAAAARISASVLLPGTPVLVPWTSFLAAAGAFTGGLAAVALSGRRALVRPVLEQFRRTGGRRSGGRAPALVDLALIVVAITGFLVLRLLGPGRAGAAVLIAPGLLVLAAALAGARGLPLLLRPLVGRTAGTRRIALLLAVRQVVRRPSGLRLVALLAVAVGVATFGVAGEAIAVQNRTARAAAEVGATAVQRIQVPYAVDPVLLVRRADPEGRWAAAVAAWLPSGGDAVNGTVLAVDAARLRSVAVDARGLPSASDLVRAIRRGAVPPLRLTGTRVAVVLRTSAVRGPAPAVRLELRDRHGAAVSGTTTTLREGTHEYAVRVPCAGGCDFAGVTWVRQIDALTAPASATSTLTAIRVDGKPVAARLTEAGAWHAALASGDETDRVTAGAGGVVDRYRSTGGEGGIAFADVLYPVPAAVTPDAVLHDGLGARLPVTALYGGATAELRTARRDPVLPVVLDDGVLVDVESLTAALPTFSADSHWAVWLGPHAPADAAARLQRAGLQLDGAPVLLAAREAALAREGPGLALLLLLVTAVAGALLAVGGTTVSIGAALRRRSYETAALAAVGVRRPQLFRAVLLEQLLLLGTALVLGVPSGLVAVVLALPAIPQSTTSTPVPMVALPPAAPVVAFAALFALLVVLAAVIGARRVMRAGSAGRLREAEE